MSRRLLSLLLGVLTAFGGFIDIGDLVADAVVGARFGLSLAWVTVIAVVVIICYAEMAGRVAAVTGRAAFDVVREGVPRRLALATLILTVLVTGVLVMAEMSGVALALQIASGIDYRWFIPLIAVVAFTMATRWQLQAIERLLGGLGMLILVYVAAVFALHPDYGALGASAIPRVPGGEGPVAYAFFAVSLIGAQATPYEIYFFSSGAVEHSWAAPRNLYDIRANVLVGFPLGASVAIAIQAVAAIVLLPQGVHVDSLTDTIQPVVTAFGRVGLAVALAGTFAVTLGATMETLFSAAYSAAQALNWPWGTEKRWHEARRYHRTLAGVTLAAAAFALTGVNPIFVTIVAVVLNAATLPFIMVPLLRAGNDRERMGEQVNGRLSRTVGVVSLGLIVPASVAAVPLLLLTGGG